jgi:hypothetical protein
LTIPRGRKRASWYRLPDSARPSVSGVFRRPLRRPSMVGWYLRARHQRERYNSATNQKSASHNISPVFNFVYENTGHSLKLRWLRDLRLPSVGLMLRCEEGLARVRISHFRSRRKTSDVDVPAVWRERTGNQALFSGHGNSVRHVTVSVRLGSGCFRHADVARIRRRWDRSRSWRSLSI